MIWRLVVVGPKSANHPLASSEVVRFAVAFACIAASTINFAVEPYAAFNFDFINNNPSDFLLAFDATLEAFSLNIAIVGFVEIGEVAASTHCIRADALATVVMDIYSGESEADNINFITFVAVTSNTAVVDWFEVVTDYSNGKMYSKFVDFASCFGAQDSGNCYTDLPFVISKQPIQQAAPSTSYFVSSYAHAWPFGYLDQFDYWLISCVLQASSFTS